MAKQRDESPPRVSARGSRRRRPGSRIRPILSALAIVAVLVVAFLYALLRPAGETPNPRVARVEQSSLPVRAADDLPLPPTDYVGSQTCAQCHADVAERYASHPMANALTTVADASPIERYADDPQFEAEGAHYRVEKRGDRVFHTEYLANQAGNVVCEQEVEVHYAVGSGAKARSYLIDRGGLLFESPISWYIENERWDLSPGYHKNPRQRFNRRVSDGCVQCHAGHVVPVDGGNSNRFHPQTFGELSIGCERCHGPGKKHVALFESLDSGVDVDVSDPLIVNPTSLQPRLRDSVCYQCHMEGKRRILRKGKTFHDFRPGMATEDVWTVFVSQTPFESDGSARFTSQVEQMRSSACFKGTGGEMTCITCHDPHYSPKPAERVAFYRERCNSCHSEQGCSVSEEVRHAAPAFNSCMHCHMPMLSSSDIPHTSQSDHRVLRNPHEERTADRATRRGTPWGIFDDSDQRMPEPEVRRARALALYEQGFEELDPQLVAQSAAALEAIAADNRDDARVLRSLGIVYAKTNSPSKAARYFAAALQADPDDETSLMNLGLMAFRRRDYATGMQCYERLFNLNPYDGPSHGPYAEMLAAGGNLQKAIAAANRGLELDPTVRPMRSALSRLYDSVGEAEKSRYHKRLAEEIQAQLMPSDQRQDARRRRKVEENRDSAP